MRKILAGAVIALAAILIYRSCIDDRDAQQRLQESTALIEQQIQNVSKLVVTEGQFAEVYSYSDSRELFGPLITADKKALVVVNAEVQVVYDLQKIIFEVDAANKTLLITSLPEPEIKIHPDLEYYDVSADYFNPFDAADYNQIKDGVQRSLQDKVEASALKANAENRLITELGQFLVLTRSLGWTLVYDKRPITEQDDWLELLD